MFLKTVRINSAFLCHIFEKSLKDSEVPTEWREANVTPIFKKGNKLEASNYRPVSLTSIVCKVLEDIVRERMMAYVQGGGLIAPEQHGFVPKKACLTNLLETLDAITDAVNKGYSVDLILLDFSKAFDKMSHKKLIAKLRAYGIDEILVKWTKALLTERRQRVVIGDNQSDWKEVTSGVPQGSVIGPSDFTLFINDLPDKLTHIVKLYADDSKLIRIVKEDSDFATIQNDINKMQNWAKEWQMSFNYDKCKVMHFGNKNPKIEYHMKLDDGSHHVIAKSDMERDLGIIISSDLKWKHQVDRSVKSAKSIIAQIRNSFKYLDLKIIDLLYKTLIRLHVEYAVPIWKTKRVFELNVSFFFSKKFI